MITLETNVEELNRLGLLSVRAMNACRNGGIHTLGQLISINETQLIKLRNCGKRTWLELNLFKTQFSEQYIEDIQDKITGYENSKLNESQIKLELLPPNLKVKLQSWIKWRFSQLSVRATKAFPKLLNAADIIFAIYSVNSLNILSIKNCGKKTQTEIDLYLADFKKYFEDITEEIDISEEAPKTDRREKEIVELNLEYPFLLITECEAIVEFTSQTRLFPYLYVAKLYITRSENPRLNIYRDYYGLNNSFSRLSISTIGEKNNLSRERIRQLINQAFPLPLKLQDGIKHYLCPLIGDVVAFDNILWNKIQRENMLEESYSQTALLVCSLLDTYTITLVSHKNGSWLKIK